MWDRDKCRLLLVDLVEENQNGQLEIYIRRCSSVLSFLGSSFARLINSTSVICLRQLVLLARAIHCPSTEMVNYIIEGAGPGLVISCIVPLVFTWFFFCMRIYVRWIMLKMWKVEDWLFVASQVSFASTIS
jgi:hypothetical protein